MIRKRLLYALVAAAALSAVVPIAFAQVQGVPDSVPLPLGTQGPETATIPEQTGLMGAIDGALGSVNSAIGSLFGDASSQIYRILFLVFVFLGLIIASTNILNFGDLMILGMAFPNLLGVYLLHGRVKKELDVYWAKYKAGELTRYK